MSPTLHGSDVARSRRRMLPMLQSCRQVVGDFISVTFNLLGLGLALVLVYLDLS